MGRQRINSEDVEVVVVAADGTTDPQVVLTEREVATVGAVDATLQAAEQFEAAYPHARLEHVESMRGVEEHRHGRYYLRYHWAQGNTEFWGYLSPKQPTFDFKKGVVGVVATPDTPVSAPT
jgi:hypothetical protein